MRQTITSLINCVRNTINVFPENFLFGSLAETKESLSGIQMASPFEKPTGFRITFLSPSSKSKRKMSGKTLSRVLSFRHARGAA